MTLLQCYYLEYFCAFLTATAFWMWLYYFSRARLLQVRREAGKMLCVVRKPRSYRAPLIALLTIGSILLGLTIYWCFFYDGNTSPTGIFLLSQFFLVPVYRWRKARIALEVHERGIITTRISRLPYLPWETIVFCKWMRSHNYLHFLSGS